jgi:hypothetical protein
VERRRTGWVAGCGREKSDDQAGVEEEREGLEGEPGRGGGDVGCQGIHGSGCESVVVEIPIGFVRAERDRLEVTLELPRVPRSTTQLFKCFTSYTTTMF